MKTYILILLISMSLLTFMGEVNAANYTLLETIGKNTGSVDFPTYITNLHKFAVGFVALAALLMITLGGFAYMTAAGNQAQVGTAKKLIIDALLGLIIVFISWLILNTINPDLLNTENPSMKKLQDGANNNGNNSTSNNNVGGGTTLDSSGLGTDGSTTDTSSGTGSPAA
ncbi:MAG: pilin [Candidatus Moraniibacteriota bacterium]